MGAAGKENGEEAIREAARREAAQRGGGETGARILRFGRARGASVHRF